MRRMQTKIKIYHHRLRVRQGIKIPLFALKIHLLLINISHSKELWTKKNPSFAKNSSKMASAPIKESVSLLTGSMSWGKITNITLSTRPNSVDFTEIRVSACSETDATSSTVQLKRLQRTKQLKSKAKGYLILSLSYFWKLQVRRAGL